MLIRDAKPEDAAAICALCVSALGYECPLGERGIAKRLGEIAARGEERVFVACEGGKVAGFAHIAPYQPLFEPKMKNVLGLAVDERFRHQGAGRALLERIEQTAREDGCGAVRLNSADFRVGAHEFYRRCGYEIVKTQKQFVKAL